MYQKQSWIVKQARVKGTCFPVSLNRDLILREKQFKKTKGT